MVVVTVGVVVVVVVAAVVGVVVAVAVGVAVGVGVGVGVKGVLTATSQAADYKNLGGTMMNDTKDVMSAHKSGIWTGACLILIPELLAVAVLAAWKLGLFS